MAPPSFIESGFLTRVEYEKALASGMAGATVSGGAPMELGYWKIRGLAAACRMMFHFKSTSFKNVAYGEDAKTEWFGKDKVELAKKNAMINLPYIVDGNTVVTQSNSCLIYLGQKLGIDAAEHMIHNHQVLDQTMDLRNDLMKIIYNPAHADFKPALEGHMKGAATHLAKFEGFCKGPFMCGPAMQSGDFHVFEMIDQHVMMCSELGAAFDLKAYPKLATLHTRVKNTPELLEEPSFVKLKHIMHHIPSDYKGTVFRILITDVERTSMGSQPTKDQIVHKIHYFRMDEKSNHKYLYIDNETPRD